MPRKGENIYKRKDSRWEGRYIKSRSLEGKAIYGYIYAKTYREVRSKLHEKSCATPIASDPIMSPDLFGTLAQEWLSNARLQTKESTANKYQNLLDSYILPFCKINLYLSFLMFISKIIARNFYLRVEKERTACLRKQLAIHCLLFAVY